MTRDDVIQLAKYYTEWAKLIAEDDLPDKVRNLYPNGVPAEIYLIDHNPHPATADVVAYAKGLESFAKKWAAPEKV